MHIESLKVFCDLVELQSFSLAAERNFVTQSAVSQQVKSLEDKFKRRMLERVRGRREVKLTPAGEVFLPLARDLVGRADRAASVTIRCGCCGRLGSSPVSASDRSSAVPIA